MNNFTPKDPEFEARVRSGFGLMAAMSTLGADLVSVTPGKTVIEMPHDQRLTQQHGFLHAGISTTMLDTACGFAAATLMPGGTGVLTIEFKVNFLAPGLGDRFRFVGEVLKPGRTITVCEGRAFAIKDGVEKLVASMSATMMTVTDRDHVKG